MICGRSSCPITNGITELNRTATVTPAATRVRMLQCKILNKALGLKLPGLIHFHVWGEFGMKVNDKAPDFTLQDENGIELALKDLRGKTVVLFFYPRANTPG